MKTKSRYVFGAAIASIALGSIPAVSHRAQGAIITTANFSFESLAAGSTTQSGAFVNGVTFLAESGLGTVIGFHSVGGTFTAAGPVTSTAPATATVFSAPAGNGSAKSLSAQNWAPGDYYQFLVPTTLIDGVMVSFDQTGSATGPGVFSLLYSSNGGGSYSSFANYTLPYSSASSASAFATGSSNTTLHFSFDLSAITDLNENSNAVFEIVDAATTPFNPTTTPGTGGTDRIDNVVVSGTAVAPVPEPGSLALLSVASAATLFRRRSNS